MISGERWSCSIIARPHRSTGLSLNRKERGMKKKETGPTMIQEEKAPVIQKFALSLLYESTSEGLPIFLGLQSSDRLSGDVLNLALLKVAKDSIEWKKAAAEEGARGSILKRAGQNLGPGVVGREV